MTFVNPQTTVYVNEDQIDDSNVRNLTKDGKYDASEAWSFDTTNWYYGPVLSMKLDCRDCLDGPSKKNIFQIENKVREN